jgi:hypothetical protein
MWCSNDHLTAIRRRERAPSTTSTADSCIAVKTSLFDRLVGGSKQRRRHFEAERRDVELLNVDASAKISTYLSGTNDGVFSSTVYTLARKSRCSCARK